MILTHGANSIEHGAPAPADSVLIGDRYYHYVQIGSQLWIDKNLDYKFDVNGSQIPIGAADTRYTPAAWYYNNDEATYGVNGNKYGLLYDWYAVKYLEDNKSTLLPQGWHVPSAAEWDALATAVGGTNTAGTKLKSTTGWSSGNGDDSYGFGAFPAGQRYPNNFSDLGNITLFWTASSYSNDVAYYRYFDKGLKMNSSDFYSTYGFSVRLVKNVT